MVQKGKGIQWTSWTHLDDLDFAVDLDLVSRAHNRCKRRQANLFGMSAGEKVRFSRKEMQPSFTTPTILDGDALEEVTNFAYLGSIASKQGGMDADEKVLIGRARTACLQMMNNRTSSCLTFSIEVGIFNTTIKPVVLYGDETWRTMVATMKKIQATINTCLRRFLWIPWPETIKNRELCERTKQQPAEDKIHPPKMLQMGRTHPSKANDLYC